MDLRKLALVILVGLAAACGGSSKTSSSTSSTSTPASTGPSASSSPTSPVPVPPSSASTTSAVAVAVTCPSASAIGAALGGRTYPAPLTLPATGLQPGAHGVACEYLNSSTFSATIVDLGSGVTDPGTNLSTTEAAQQAAAKARGGSVTFTKVSGVGSRAVYFNFSIPGHTENGIFAGNGSSYFVAVTYPAATEAQLEELARQTIG
jgi:hypothetical protein